MKLMIASDLHGSALYTELLAERFREESAERLLLLGDILYHGPRNDLPDGHGPKAAVVTLNAMADSIMCVRGNCDAEIDQQVLDFPITADYIMLPVDGRLIFATHGHRYSRHMLPPMDMGDIMVSGHTHVIECDEECGMLFLNPGSVSLPKGGCPHSFMTYEDGLFLWKDISTGAIFKEYRLKRSFGR